MQVRIEKTFSAPALTPLQFTQNEFVDVPDEIARRWFAEGRAVPLDSLKGAALRPPVPTDGLFPSEMSEGRQRRRRRG
jgi:hypothetical protein